MKLSLRTLSSLALLSGSVAITQLQTGCAGTNTRESTGEYVDDATITAKVKAAFVKDPVVKATDVKVQTFKGVVQLSGFVDNSDQKSQAEQVARGVPNVAKVQNDIVVKAR